MKRARGQAPCSGVGQNSLVQAFSLEIHGEIFRVKIFNNFMIFKQYFTTPFFEILHETSTFNYKLT